MITGGATRKRRSGEISSASSWSVAIRYTRTSVLLSKMYPPSSWKQPTDHHCTVDPDSAPDKYNTSNALGKSQINTREREIKFYGSYNINSFVGSAKQNRTKWMIHRRPDERMRWWKGPVPLLFPIYHWKWLFNDSYFFPMMSLNKWIFLSWPPLPSLLVLLIEGNRRLLVRWFSSSFRFPACLPQSAHWQSKVNPRGWDCSPEERELHFWICAVIFVWQKQQQLIKVGVGKAK